MQCGRPLCQHTCPVFPVDPAGFDDVAEELQQQWQASAQSSDQQQNPAMSQQQQQTPDQHQQESSLQHIHRATPAADAINFDLFPSTPSSLQQSLTLRDTKRGLAFNAFSDAGIVRQSEQVGEQISLTSCLLGVSPHWIVLVTVTPS